jgi:hypothetical protein
MGRLGYPHFESRLPQFRSVCRYDEIQTERDLMLVRLACCVVMAVSVLMPHGARAGDCADEISKLMSKDTEARAPS